MVHIELGDYSRRAIILAQGVRHDCLESLKTSMGTRAICPTEPAVAQTCKTALLLHGIPHGSGPSTFLEMCGKSHEAAVHARLRKQKKHVGATPNHANNSTTEIPHLKYET